MTLIVIIIITLAFLNYRGTVFPGPAHSQARIQITKHTWNQMWFF